MFSEVSSKTQQNNCSFRSLQQKQKFPVLILDFHWLRCFWTRGASTGPTQVLPKYGIEATEKGTSIMAASGSPTFLLGAKMGGGRSMTNCKFIDFYCIFL